MDAFIGPLNCCGHQRYAELQAALKRDHPQADEEESRQVFQGGFGYGRGYRLMRPDLFLRRPRRSYNVTAGGKTVRVGAEEMLHHPQFPAPRGWLQEPGEQAR